jgi:Domain of unknown function (DUF6268)
VKKRIALLFTSLWLMHHPLCADYDSDGTGLDSNIQQEQQPSGSAFTFKVDGEWIGQSKFKKKDSFKGSKLHFWEIYADAQAVVYYDSCVGDAVALDIGYKHMNLHWKSNPFFDQRNFNQLGFSIDYQTKRLCNWTWTASLTYIIDADRWNFDQYSLWDAFLWGRYTYRPDIGVHIGLYVETGMKMDRVWPIIGFDWTISKRLKLNLVYPVNMALEYKWDDHWTFIGGIRIFSERARVSSHEQLRKAVWRYCNAGAEFGVNYDPTHWLSLNAHAGYTFSGYLRVANQHNKHSHHLRFNSAPYAGGELTLKF